MKIPRQHFNPYPLLSRWNVWNAQQRKEGGNTVYAYRKKNTQRNLSGAAWLFIHGVTHSAISWQREGVRPVKIKPASILASIQNRGKLSGHKPQTETQTPCPASLGTAQRLSLRPKPLLFQECWLVLGCHHHPSAFSAVVHRQHRQQLLPSTTDAKFPKHKHGILTIRVR